MKKIILFYFLVCLSLSQDSNTSCKKSSGKRVSWSEQLTQTKLIPSLKQQQEEELKFSLKELTQKLHALTLKLSA